MICKYHPYIDDYISGIKSGEIIVGEDIKAAIPYVEKRLSDPDVYINVELIEKAVELMEKYFEIKLFDWELFVTALLYCYYKSTDTVVFSTLFIMMGRGNGKNGFISPTAWFLSTHYHGIKVYNIDIIANAEDQAKTSFEDIYDVLETHWTKLKMFFYKSKELIKNLRTNSYIKFNTSNSKTKDGKRSACLIFDEVHVYENYEQLKVFKSGFGKKKHSRELYITTNGDVREGVLDDMLSIAGDILNGTITDLDWLPLIYRIDKEEEALDETMWHKANPSLKYLPLLQKEMKKHFIEMKYTPELEESFYGKRCNFPRGRRDLQVADWNNIIATNKPVPDLTGRTAVVGIDYTKTTDFASVNLHFREGNTRYDISHSWLCLKSHDLARLKVPWQRWGEEGLLTIVDDVEINPELIADYIAEQMLKYNLVKIALDSFRYALLANALSKLGFDAKENKNIVLVRPSDIMKTAPIIGSCFVNNYYIWGDNPVLRWATNNTKMVASGKKEGTDTGNYYYAKIEGKSRKTDPFMALVAAMVIENELGDGIILDMPEIDVHTY